MDTNKNDNKAYVIIEGKYNNRHIDRVFSKKELAYEYLDARGNGYYLKEYSLGHQPATLKMSRLGS